MTSGKHLTAFVFLFVFVICGALGDRHERRARAREERKARDFDRYHGRDIDRPVTREDILDNLNQRKEQLEIMLQASEKKLEEHESGVNVMDNKELESVEKRVNLVRTKLERWAEPDERELEVMRVREERRLDRRRSRASEL